MTWISQARNMSPQINTFDSLNINYIAMTGATQMTNMSPRLKTLLIIQSIEPKNRNFFATRGATQMTNISPHFSRIFVISGSQIGAVSTQKSPPTPLTYIQIPAGCSPPTHRPNIRISRTSLLVLLTTTMVVSWTSL